MSIAPNWIEAIGAALAAVATVCIAVLTFLTLKVLRVYADDTKRIANDSATQVERGQMPFVSIGFVPHVPGGQASWVIENQGFGPAMNIRCHYGAQNAAGNAVSGEQYVPSLAVNGRHPASPSLHRAIQNQQPVEIEYTSLSGKRYSSLAATGRGQVETEFRQLADEQ
jgi:hypothetical protein